MKKILAVLLVLGLLVGCSTNEEENANMLQIGVLQLMDHKALNNTYQGFIDALEDNGYVEGENIIINFQNPNNDKSVLATMAQALVNDDCDLILAIGTGAAQALQRETTEIPILGSAITDYEEAQLVASNEAPGANISGASDYVDMAIQMDLVEMMVPDVETVGLLYTSSEINSEVQAQQMKEECAKRGWKVEEKTISDMTMVNDAMMALVGSVDALYIPTDNPLASAMASVEIVASEYSLPVIVGCDTMVADGGLASLGVNYYELGYKTGEQAVSVLKGEVNISELPVYFSDSETLNIYYNSRVAQSSNITLPESITSVGVDIAQ